MNLYRLDFLNPDGTTSRGVTGADVGWVLSSDVLVRSYALARTTAIAAAQRHGHPVAVSTIRGAGHMKRTSIVDESGRVRNCKNIQRRAIHRQAWDNSFD